MSTTNDTNSTTGNGRPRKLEIVPDKSCGEARTTSESLRLT